MTAYYGFALFAICIGATLFGMGIGLHWGVRVGEKRGQMAAEFAYSYGLLNKDMPSMVDAAAKYRQATQAAAHGLGVYQGLIGSPQSTWTVSGVGGGGGGGSYCGVSVTSPLAHIGSSGSQISSKV